MDLIIYTRATHQFNDMLSVSKLLSKVMSSYDTLL